MKKEIFIFPSILSANPLSLTEEIISLFGEGGADGIHIDYMNPPFVPNSTEFNPLFLKLLKESLSKNGFDKIFYDVHIMSNNPDKVLEEFALSGADLITVHYESSFNLKETLKKIKLLNKKVGLALNPETPVSNINNYIEMVDLILIMTVNPGKGGQGLIENCLDKIKETKELIREKKLNVLLQVDGGINLDNIEIASKKGANVFVSGSTIFKSSNRLETISKMRKTALN